MTICTPPVILHSWNMTRAIGAVYVSKFEQVIYQSLVRYVHTSNEPFLELSHSQHTTDLHWPYSMYKMTINLWLRPLSKVTVVLSVEGQWSIHILTSRGLALASL